MEYNVFIAGVGGQGTISIGLLISQAALSEGLNIKQSEIHGMSQRGGAVYTSVRMSDKKIASDLIPMGRCDLLISVEPLEAVRHLDVLKPEGVIVTSVDPFENIPNYPATEALWKNLEVLPQVYPIHAMDLARDSGSVLAQSMIILGAASVFLPIDRIRLASIVSDYWKSKGQRVLDINLIALRKGYETCRSLQSARAGGASLAKLRELSKAHP